MIRKCFPRVNETINHLAVDRLRRCFGTSKDSFLQMKNGSLSRKPAVKNPKDTPLGLSNLC